MTELERVIRDTLTEYAEHAPTYDFVPVAAQRTRAARWAPALAAAAVLVVSAVAVGVHAVGNRVVTPADQPTASTTPSPTGPQTCSSDQLDVSLGAVAGAAGTSYRSIRVTNTDGQSCVLDGLPTFTLAGGDLVAPLAVLPQGMLVKPHVTLDPNATVDLPVALAVPNPDNWQPPGPCRPATPAELDVSVGGDTTTTVVWTATVCSGDQGAPYLTSVVPQ